MSRAFKWIATGGAGVIVAWWLWPSSGGAPSGAPKLPSAKRKPADRCSQALARIMAAEPGTAAMGAALKAWPKGPSGCPDPFGNPNTGSGTWGSLGAVGDALSGLAIAGGYVLPLVPGVGTAANIALQGAVALGKGKSLSSAILAAARGALPPWGQVAFDLGVGVASGKPVDQLAISAALKQLGEKYPQAAQAYADGKALAK